MKTLPAFLLTAALALTVAHAAPEVGKPAPDFTLKDSAGKDRSLAEFKGKTVVLEWYNEGCPFVVKHYGSGNMPKLQEQVTGDGAVWLTIVSSAEGKQGHLTPEAAAKKMDGTLKSTALLLDADGKVGKLYDAKTTPEIFIVNEEGTLVYKGAIDNKPTPNPADIEGATNYVTTTLAALKAGKPVEPAQTKPYGCSVKY